MDDVFDQIPNSVYCPELEAVIRQTTTAGRLGRVRMGLKTSRPAGPSDVHSPILKLLDILLIKVCAL